MHQQDPPQINRQRTSKDKLLSIMLHRRVLQTKRAQGVDAFWDCHNTCVTGTCRGFFVPALTCHTQKHEFKKPPPTDFNKRVSAHNKSETKCKGLHLKAQFSSSCKLVLPIWHINLRKTVPSWIPIPYQSENAKLTSHQKSGVLVWKCFGLKIQTFSWVNIAVLFFPSNDHKLTKLECLPFCGNSSVLKCFYSVYTASPSRNTAKRDVLYLWVAIADQQWCLVC